MFLYLFNYKIIIICIEWGWLMTRLCVQTHAQIKMKCKFDQTEKFQLFAASSLCGVTNTVLPSLSISGKENVPPFTVTGHEFPHAGAK